MAQQPRQKHAAKHSGAPPETQRLDKWLWHARFVKSRSLAIKLVEAGNFRINRQKVTKASALVKCGDVLTAALGNRVVLIEITGIALRRGPPTEARQLYVERPINAASQREPPPVTPVMPPVSPLAPIDDDAN